MPGFRFLDEIGTSKVMAKQDNFCENRLLRRATRIENPRVGRVGFLPLREYGLAPSQVPPFAENSPGKSLPCWYYPANRPCLCMKFNGSVGAVSKNVPAELLLQYMSAVLGEAADVRFRRSLAI